MAWYDAQVPAWLTPGSISGRQNENVRTGLAQAQVAHEAWMDRAKEARQEQSFPLEQQMRQSQIASNLLNLKGAQLKLDAEVLNKSGFAALAQKAQEITQTPNGWLDAKAESDIWKIGAQFPTLLETPQFKDTVANFGRARAAELGRLKAEDAAAIGAGKLDVALAGVEARKAQIDALTARADLDRESREKLAGEKLNLESQKIDLQRELKYAELSQRAQDKAAKRLEDMQFRRYMTALTTLKDKASYAKDPLAAFEKEIDALDARFGIKAEPSKTPIGPPMPVKPTVVPRVRVESPDGKVGTVPENQLEDALQRGYKRL